jgi:hypothetical protein
MDELNEYVPWPSDGCNLTSAAGRLTAGIPSRIEGAKESCQRLLLRGDLIAYGREQRHQEDAARLIRPSTWSGFKIDWRVTRVFGSDGIEISDIRVFPPIIAPCRLEILDQMPIAEAFRRFVLNDPEVHALAAVALPVAPKWKSLFAKGESIFADRGDWPVDLDRWWFARPVHPDPSKRSVYERQDQIEPLELIIAVEALKQRYRGLIALLQTGTMTARGVPGRAGFTEQIMRAVWSHEDFHLRVSTGDVLQDNEQSVDRYDRTVKSWIGVVLCKPATEPARAAWGNRDIGADVSREQHGPPSSATECGAPVAERKKANKRIDTATKSYRECVAWLVQMMKASPNVRTATIDGLWDEAKLKWPATLSRRAFEDARNEAIRTVGAQAWTAAGRSKKSPQSKSPR